MFGKKKDEELENLTPAALEARKKQRSLNRIFGLLCVVILILVGMLIVEFVALF